MGIQRSEDIAKAKKEKQNQLSFSDAEKTAEKNAEKVLIEKDLFAAIKTANNLKSPIFIVGSLYLGANARKYYKK